MVLRKKIKTRFKVGEIKRFSFNQNLKMFVMGSSGNSCLLYSTACFLFLFKRDFLFVLGTMMSDFFFPGERERWGEEEATNWDSWYAAVSSAADPSRMDCEQEPWLSSLGLNTSSFYSLISSLDLLLVFQTHCLDAEWYFPEVRQGAPQQTTPC